MPSTKAIYSETSMIYPLDACKLSGKNNLNYVKGPGWINCNDPDNSCATCYCEISKSERKLANLKVEQEGCRKPKTCSDICGKPGDHSIGDTWKCPLEGFKYV